MTEDQAMVRAWLTIAAAVVLIGGVIVFTTLTTLTARSAEHNHPPAHAQLHDKFYVTWKRPDLRVGEERYASCCNREDCYPTQMRMQDKVLMYLHRETQSFKPMRMEVLEERQGDPVDSPDGQNHVCANSTGYVFCGVRGGGG